MKQQKGAALTETFVLMLVMTPLMFGIPMIGKLIDLRQTTVQASRYAAWESTVSQQTVAPSDIKDRFFSAAHLPLGASASIPNQLWGDQSDGEDSSPLRDVQSQTLADYWGPEHTAVVLDENTGAAVPFSSAYDSGANGQVALNIQDMVNSAAHAAADVTGGDWMARDNHTKGLVRADVRADVQANGWFDTLSFDDGTVIMNDNWSSGTDRQAAERVRAMVPAGALEEIGSTVSLFGNFPLFKELKGLDEAFGHVDMRPLPAGESPYVAGSRVQRPELKDYEE